MLCFVCFQYADRQSHCAWRSTLKWRWLRYCRYCFYWTSRENCKKKKKKTELLYPTTLVSSFELYVCNYVYIFFFLIEKISIEKNFQKYLPAQCIFRFYRVNNIYIFLFICIHIYENSLANGVILFETTAPTWAIHIIFELNWLMSAIS